MDLNVNVILDYNNILSYHSIFLFFLSALLGIRHLFQKY